MSRPIIGLVDYGAGNYASVKRLISKLGYRSQLVNKQKDLIDAMNCRTPPVAEPMVSRSGPLRRNHSFKRRIE